VPPGTATDPLLRELVTAANRSPARPGRR
jgi:hypothetical protein